MKKPNHMWRISCVGYEGTEAQCLTCKEYFAADRNRVYRYCPACGIELKIEFIKRNKRWGWLKFERHFPIVEIWTLEDIYPDRYSMLGGLANIFGREESKPTQKWSYHYKTDMSFNGFGFRKNLLHYIEYASKRVDSPSKIKIVVKTWDNKEKTIYGTQLKSVFNRKYQKIAPPKPYTIACSGVMPDYMLKVNSKLIEQSIFGDIYKTGGF